MREETSNLTRILRVMDEKLDRLIEDVHDVKLRLTAVEEALAGVNRRIDCTETRLDRIEKRLNLVDAS
jgi:DNA repair ATPase RecN